jgi:hypothetical protein
MQESQEEVNEVGSALHTEFQISPMVMLQDVSLTNINTIP